MRFHSVQFPRVRIQQLLGGQVHVGPLSRLTLHSEIDLRVELEPVELPLVIPNARYHVAASGSRLRHSPKPPSEPNYRAMTENPSATLDTASPWVSRTVSLSDRPLERSRVRTGR